MGCERRIVNRWLIPCVFCSNYLFEVFLTMDEPRRLAYLNAMGIDCALVSRQGSLLKPQAVHSRDTHISIAPRRAEKIDQDAVSSSGKVSAPETKIKETVAPEATRESLSAVTELLRFSLQFYSLTTNFAVINEIPFRSEERTHYRTEALLGAILVALGDACYPAAGADKSDDGKEEHDPAIGSLPRPARFNWPLTTGDDVPQASAREALQAVEGFLRKRLDGADYRVIAVLSSQRDVLFGPGQPDGIDALFNTLGLTAVYSHSLDELLRIPSLKSVAWNELRVIPDLLIS